ncbi:hypothetical protein C474_15864 [Halogeometricum pallidum JCM 14848]|uniref:Cox cluster protein n=1 Tax=Halogeometricum pallidum JCM 14848 TaxID=1227487 RepID=M0D014_HALPD|nr:DUF6684 family protein [Halogeometricum pallidum]ELZ27992.1 hypothetical protein C474_15864 [Halogeometricum pallidum JCM 14848]
MSPSLTSIAGFDYETLLDITVNLVPMGILLFFVGVNLVFTPYPYDPFAMNLTHMLTLIPLVFLGLLTIVSARAISSSGDESGDNEAVPESDKL